MDSTIAVLIPVLSILLFIFLILYFITKEPKLKYKEYNKTEKRIVKVYPIPADPQLIVCPDCKEVHAYWSEKEISYMSRINGYFYCRCCGATFELEREI